MCDPGIGTAKTGNEEKKSHAKKQCGSVLISEEDHFLFIMVGSFLALVLFDWLGTKANTDLLFTLITTTRGS